ncbi:tocopherol cyclase family protein [Dysosmobacter sp.]|uniref:tocopherol cyclase family protein n=1 Tax=Dysosmobacter sp. TaxID=2591382 RepID=UPI002A84D058|nr:tocopherol cyclase family protein [Dysosmobacter sp.]MDY3280762.1 tocopherol cyclase family protein [Dysosmobacter sp.]
MRYFHGEIPRGPYFEDWYCKCRTAAGQAVALIPAYHVDSGGRPGASLQVISGGGSWWVDYPAPAFDALPAVFWVKLGENRFRRQGLRLRAETEGLSLSGELRFGPFTPPRRDVMGPFRFLPGMECVHGVLSMAHPLAGSLTLNGEVLDFTGGTGYLETDRGRSFPRRYLWVQCSCPAEEGSLMLAAAEVPVGPLRFPGCLCVVRHGSREYRLATYRGGRVTAWSAAGAEVRQGAYCLQLEFPAGEGHPLRAPRQGAMSRTVRERVQSEVRCRLLEGQRTVLAWTDPCGSFECSESGL